METLKKYIPIYLRICRTVFLYLSFLLISFLAGLALKTMPPAKALIMFLVYQSLVRVFAETDRHTRKLALPYRESSEAYNRTSRDIWRLIWRSKAYRLELILLLLLPTVLPLEAGFTTFSSPLLAAGLSRPLTKLCLLAVILPLMLGGWFFAHYNAFLWWVSDKTAPDIHFGRALLLRLLGIAAIYGIGGVAVALFVPVVISIFYIFVSLGELRWWLPILIVLGWVALFWGLAILRVWRIRHKFIKNLAALCAEVGATLSPIERPYRSLLHLDHYPNFTVTRGEKTYHCKLFSALKRHNPLFFSEQGIVQCLHSFRFRRVEYFRYTTQFDFSFEAPAPKILIVNPVSKELFAGHTGYFRPIDTGEAVGDYKIFTATGFLGALARDVLDR